jgi:hypothetical protein
MPNDSARRLRQFACLALLTGTTGCACWNDPFACPGTWRPEQVNEANISAMVADPRQLEQGVGTDASLGALSAAAVHRLLTDHVKPLPNMDVGPIAGTGDQSAAPAPAGLTQ